MKKLYIRQHAGLGDIFFLQKAVNIFIESGYDEIIWPVIKHYEYLKYYNLNNKIKFISTTEIPNDMEEMYKQNCIMANENDVYIPFDKSAQITGNYTQFLEAKYELIKQDFTNWQQFCNFKRFDDREKKCREYFNISEQEEFIFVNPIFASPPEIYKRDIPLKTNLKIIEHKPEHLDLFNFFDFSWILENAKEIHTVETSICYLVEVLNTTTNLNLYSRKINGNNQYSNFDYVKSIYKKNWNYFL